MESPSATSPAAAFPRAYGFLSPQHNVPVAESLRALAGLAPNTSF